uniref:C-type lectin domain-containing protein n=1 Tax=Sinocyclocheilus anshuiensis TaxID=1608454 RepID=A0A671MY83_9TELE
MLLTALLVGVTNPVRGLLADCHQRSLSHYTDSHATQTVTHHPGLHFPSSIALITHTQLTKLRSFTVSLMNNIFQRFANLPWCSSHCYYIIDEFKNWTEAQDYCRKYYYDLATFNKEENDQVIQTLVSGGYNDSVWIGLYDDCYSCRWSSGEKNSAPFSKGYLPYTPVYRYKNLHIPDVSYLVTVVYFMWFM